jgi:hypothetical protein
VNIFLDFIVRLSWLEWFHFFLCSDHFGWAISCSGEGIRFIIKAAIIEIS